MPAKQFTPFYDDEQMKYEIDFYQPLGFAEAQLRVKLTPQRIHQICPECGCKTHIHEHKTRTICGGTYQGVPLIYEITDHIRYKCSQCPKTFVERYDFLAMGSSITIDMENYIIWHLGSMPMLQIAVAVGVSEQTIANRAIAFGKSERKTMLQGHYKYLSMDEVFIGRDGDNKHVIYWVLNDLSAPWKANNIMLEIGRTKEDVIERLMLLENRDKVIAVCIDMWEGYKEAVTIALPNAVIVVDRFHVIKNAEERMNDVRKRSKCSKKEKDAMKKDAALFLKSFYKLSEAELEKLEGYLKLDTQIEKMYYVLQELLELYNIRGYDEALEHLCKWETKVFESGVEEAIMLYNTIYNWLPYIMNFFCYRITNGKTEGKNNLIRQIDRMGFHYGLACLQGCLYAHDRKQEYVKWKKHQKKAEKSKVDDKPCRIRKARAA